MLTVGTKQRLTIKVTKELTAAGLASADLAAVGMSEEYRSGEEQPVLATPWLIAVMEGVAAASVEHDLEEGQTTVGTAIDIRHMAATPAGMSVTFETTLVEIDKKRLVFEAAAWDDFEMIGKGKIERYIINIDQFRTGLSAKENRYRCHSAEKSQKL